MGALQDPAREMADMHDLVAGITQRAPPSASSAIYAMRKHVNEAPCSWTA
jgi:hypothetical protein